ncbi:hypothetical protein UFOVP785_69 [uncultured Caudovirales phage]|uniref:Uncharacterized protein n=1 Tax=uncultured Caudovirales phage TaxID=2100421 RepID=A0A6J5NUZ9_9CAUD|nr:hypothetical protein UFOVP785_69 [uncultured Caudovirales phage]
MTDEEWQKLNDAVQLAKRKRDSERLVYPIFAMDREPWILPPLTEEELAAAMACVNKTEESDR